MRTRILTGITTTGTPHLGNYVGAIRPAVQASRNEGNDAFFFMADYHALIKCEDPARLQRSRLQIAATWLAAGLDPQRVTFYRQSDLPEIPQLCWLLTCVTAKGLMNRAHAYKAAVDQNVAENEDPDAGITMGLFSYPVLMAADILLFNAHRVPVGRDQIQHIEMARDIAQRFSHLYGGGRELFVLPEAQIDESVATLPGLDGRKMSKSYNNTIPLFEGGSKHLRDAIGRIVTDSRLPGEPKDPDNSQLYTIYRAFASDAEAAAFRRSLEEGMGWGDAKQALYERIEREIGPMRERYESLIARPAEIEDILQEGARKARAIAGPFLAELRAAVGLDAVQPAAAPAAKKKAGKQARFVSFRDDGGSFRFRFLAADGQDLLLSEPYADAQSAGAAIKRLRGLADPAEALRADGDSYALFLDGAKAAHGPDFAGAAARDDALAKLIAELRALAAE
ncbi:tryptophan--tRNA ligase [Pigmentiphaga sp. NML080357]|uniref:tryptophan--tRNA ligase n=1 Tax=Pigmentiphaga sp. NML080357 TaxID=2008675 RepID=UPI000B413E1B|nr:tryptophan--tRNA ligase [Pigmentiphaga sp. NML080357]OVZ64232.1 tryptophan--tRNA ligase [Pigmentiphaga sp. NML080357]